MIGVTVDISELTDIGNTMETFAPDGINGSKMLREIAITICAMQVSRIHQKGLKADGSPIGVYKDSYKKTRDKNKRSMGKVILSLTREMENDYAICEKTPIELGEQGVGIGFTKKSNNKEKQEWMEEKYGNIYGLSKDEMKVVHDITSHYIQQALK